ncbi:UvrB/UvrC motif-containing protein [Anaeromicropila herbilytica]|uniref:Excinuclease Uvr n=1 Tax=Anaeromicropila herbilytica TaxID=2785025 RepID=A0A7R7EJD8_9FIRM|nr:UvrB/UvrC motif-containing protein [Anaeromicropila herbilytica]BCN29844.1 excinuclease Uvr [Anaeromicropila herbilytica]
MLCDKCNKREAKVYYTEIVNGEKKEQHLCEECASEFTSFHLASTVLNKDISLGNLLSSILGNYKVTNTSKEKETVKELVCKECGMTYEEFTTLGKFGCAGCYNTFKKQLGPGIKKIQGADVHVGKKPKGFVTKADKIVSGLSEIEKLSIKLQQAIEKEEFEEAAKLRDSIRELKKEEEINA